MQQTATSPVQISGERARSLVRVYLADLARGDSASASSLLAAGSPDSFIDGTLQIQSVRSSSTANGEQNVTADVTIGVKSYVMSFVVGRSEGSVRILSHSSNGGT